MDILFNNHKSKINIMITNIIQHLINDKKYHRYYLINV
jgi:hypothetical protein